MKKHIYDEKNGLQYTLGDDGMYYPDIVLEEQEDCQIGKYGRMCERFLKENRTGTYISLLMSGKLHAHLYEIDTLVHQRVEEIVIAMAKRDGTNEELKAREQMEWIGRMNNYRHCAEEVVFKEIIYV